MANSDLFFTLKTALGKELDLFVPTDYKIPMLVLSVDVNALEGFYSLIYQDSIRKFEESLALMRSEKVDQAIGGTGTPFRDGLTRLFMVSQFTLQERGISEPKLRLSHAFLLDAVREQASRTHQQLSEVRRIAHSKIESLTERTVKSRDLADEALIKSLTDNSGDRAEWLKDAETRFREILDQPYGSRDPIAWMTYGWILQRRKKSLSETMNCFNQAALASSGLRDQVYLEACNYLARYQLATGSAELALQTIQKALSVKEDGEMLLQAAAYAKCAGLVEECHEYYRRALEEFPICAIAPFLYDRMGQNLTPWMQILQQQETDIRKRCTTIRKTSTKQMARWVELAKEVSREFSLPLGLREESVEAEISISQAGFFELKCLEDEWKFLAESAKRECESEIEKQLAEVNRQVASMKSKLQALQIWRATQIETIKQLQQAELDKRRVELKIDPTSLERSQRGCATSAGITFGGFALYFLLSVAVPPIGNMIGPGSKFGIGAMLLIASPCFLGMLMSCLESFRRWSAETELQRQANQLDGESLEKIKLIDAEYQERYQTQNDEIETNKRESDRIQSCLKELRTTASHQEQDLAA